MTVAGLALAGRVGPRPYGDKKHDWNDTEFAWVAG